MSFKTVLKITVIAVAIASAADVALLFLARALGVSMIVPHGPEKVKEVMAVSDVVIANALFLTIGALAFFVVSKATKKPRVWWRIIVVIGFVLTLLPVFQEIDAATRAVLVVMHVVSLGVLLWSLARMNPNVPQPSLSYGTQP